MPPQSQVISRMTKVSGGLAASSAGPGLDHDSGSPDFSLSSSANSSVHTTIKASNKVMACPARVSVPDQDAHAATKEQGMTDFLSSSSDRKTSESGCSATSGSCRKACPMTSSESSPKSVPRSPIIIHWGARDGNRKGKATPRSAGSGSQARHAQDPPELGREVVVDITSSLGSSEMGPILPEANDESSMSDSSVGTVAYQDAHAPANTNTQFFQMGSSDGDVSHPLDENVDDDGAGDDIPPLEPELPADDVGAYVAPAQHTPTPLPPVGACRGRPSPEPAATVHTVDSGTASAQQREAKTRGRVSSRSIEAGNASRQRSAKRSADNDGDSAVARQRTANGPDGGDPDPNVGAHAAIEVEGRDDKVVSRRIVELEAQINLAGKLASEAHAADVQLLSRRIVELQAHAKVMEAERDVLAGKLASEAHAAEERLTQRTAELEARIVNATTCQAHAGHVGVERDLMMEKLTSEAHATAVQLNDLRRINDGLVSQISSAEQVLLQANIAHQTAQAPAAIELQDARLRLEEELPRSTAALRERHVKDLAAQRALASQSLADTLAHETARRREEYEAMVRNARHEHDSIVGALRTELLTKDGNLVGHVCLTTVFLLTEVRRWRLMPPPPTHNC